MSSPDRISDIVARLASGREDTIAFFESLTDAEWDAPVQTEGENWRAGDMLAHFGAIERTMPILFEGILAGSENPSADFDLNHYNNSQVAKLKNAPRDFLIERFRQARRQSIDLANSLSDADLDREGVHPFLGRGTLERFIRWAYEHTALHQDEVRQVLHR